MSLVSNGRIALASAGGSGIATSFHTLNLRESAVKREKTVIQRINEQQRKKSNMRDLLV